LSLTYLLSYLSKLLRRLGTILLQCSGSITQTLSSLRIASRHLCGLLSQGLCKLLTLGIAERSELVSKLFKLLGAMGEIRALLRLSPGEGLQATRQLLEGGTTRITIRIETLLQSRLAS
jgi:hypothetical protein